MARAATVTAKKGGARAGSRKPARKRPIGLGALRGFESAARHLSFTLAADELHLSQSAVSRQVAALESEVGHRLFIRKTRALVLTPAGEQLARGTLQALNAVDRVVDNIRSQTGSPRVVVTTYPSLASLWLVPRLAVFQRTHPGIVIRINAQGRRIDLEVEGVDIALRRCPPQDAPADAIKLLDEDATPAVSAELMSRFGGRLRTPADVSRLPRIEVEEDLPGVLNSVWPRWFEAAGVEADGEANSPVMVVAYTDQSMQAAVRGHGVVLAYRPFREEMVASGHLILPFPDIRVRTGYSIYLIVSQVSRGRSAVVQLRDWLLDEFARGPARQA